MPREGRVSLTKSRRQKQRKTRNLHRCIECSRASKVPTIDLFKPDHTMVANSRGQHTLQKKNSLGLEKTIGATKGI
jgi:hypothetical protein